MLILLSLKCSFCLFAKCVQVNNGGCKLVENGPGKAAEGHLQMLFVVCTRMLSLFSLISSHLHILPNLHFNPKWWYGNGMDMILRLEQVSNMI